MSTLINYAKSYNGPTPVVLLDPKQVVHNYNLMKRGMSKAKIHYAVKANPNINLLSALNDVGCSFDAASKGEIKRLLELGVEPEKISFGNTIKKIEDIQYAYSNGIRLFAVDSVEEVDKVATYAPKSNVFIRMLITKTEAEWPLSKKFGCTERYIPFLVEYAKLVGVAPIGLSFHIGSQTKHPEMWVENLTKISKLWNQLRKTTDLYLLNIGGGFPAFYGDSITELDSYCAKLDGMISTLFTGVKYLMVEPGRGLVADAGLIVAEVVLAAKKDPEDTIRWVYLNIGKFSGLAETMEEAIKYEFVFPNNDNTKVSKCIIAGPTCDSADVLYDINKVDVPIDVKCGDKLFIKNTGAYTTTYSSVWFNGFDPLNEIII